MQAASKDAARVDRRWWIIDVTNWLYRGYVPVERCVNAGVAARGRLPSGS